MNLLAALPSFFLSNRPLIKDTCSFNDLQFIMDVSMSDADEDSPLLHKSSEQETNHEKQSIHCQKTGFSWVLPPSGVSQPSFLSNLNYLLDSSSLFVSPSKKTDITMEMFPNGKKPATRSHLQLNLEGLAKKTPCPKGVNALFNDMSGDKGELQPTQLFIASPDSFSPDFKTMMDDIDVPHYSEGSDEDFLKRQAKTSLRRCRSLEMRKHLFDVSNTPPNTFKKNTFKRPSDVSVVQFTCMKRLREKTGGCHGKGFSCPSTIKEEAQTLSHLDEAVSEDHERIKIAVDALESPDLIADGSRVYCLPVITGKHSDLKNIHHQTMADLLTNKFQGFFDQLTVIDCRYPYEYNGGHIKNAVNIYTEEDTMQFLNQEMQKVTVTTHKHILIFHCEFSSQRGPNLLRHLRKCDRQMNAYPRLTYPEIYCLFGGYKDFFHNHPEFCEPSSYVPMTDEKYISDLKHFRAKAKSWAAGEKYKPKQKL